MKNKKVNILLVIIGIMAILFAIFAYNRTPQRISVPPKEYMEHIKELEDSIRMLRVDIHQYQKRLDTLKKERTKVEYQIKEIIKDNEKTDRILANGDWDTNIRFLTDFLSKKDSVQK